MKVTIMKKIILYTLLTLAHLSADTLIVGGGESGSYSKVQDAINAASDGDTVFINAGTYIETVSNTKDIAIIGSGMGVTLIYSASSPTLFSRNGILKNLSVQTTSTRAGEINGGVTVYNCEFIGSCTGSSSCTALYAQNGNTVYNSILRDSYYGLSGGKAFNCILYNNTYGFSGLEIQNSILYNNAYGLNNTGGLHVYNIYSGNTNYGVTLALGEKNEDPKFENAPTSWLLKSDSGLFDAGNPASNFKDFDGSINDIGIYGGAHSPGNGPSVTTLSISSNSVNQGTKVTITATAKSNN